MPGDPQLKTPLTLGFVALFAMCIGFFVLFITGVFTLIVFNDLEYCERMSRYYSTCQIILGATIFSLIAFTTSLSIINNYLKNKSLHY